MKNTKVTTQKQARKASSKKKAQDPRWSFNLKPTKWGPFETQGASIDSRNVRSLRTTDRSMVGLGTRAVDIQRKMPRLQTTISENGNVVDLLTGTDLLKSITSPDTGAVAGDLLFTQEISPSLFANSRLLQFSQLYQRYRFRKIYFFYEPIANATQSGQLLGFADFDVDNILSVNAPENLNIGAAHQGQSITQIWQPCLFDMGQLFTFTDLYTEQGATDTSDPRMSIQGVFYVLAASVLGSSLPLGNIYVDYEIEFSIPFLSTAGAVASRYSFGLEQGQFHQYSSDIMTLQSGASLGKFGPVVADYASGSASILWTNVQPGDVFTVFLWNEPYATTKASTASTNGNPIVNITGGSLITQFYNDLAYVAGVLQWGVFCTIRAAPIAGSMAITISSPIAAEINAPSNTSLWSWTMEPASVALSNRARSARQKEVDSLKKQLAVLSDLVQGLSQKAVERQESAESNSAPLSLRPAPSVCRKVSHELEFTHVGTHSDRPLHKVIASADLSDSDEEDEPRDYPLDSKASGDVLRRVRRVGA